MRNRKTKIIDPWKAEAWELRDWLCEKAEEEYGKLNIKRYLTLINRKASKIFKENKICY